MGKVIAVILFLSWLGGGACAQKTPNAPSTQKPPTAPADETRTPAPVRSIHSMAGDWTVPLCPTHFHDSLRSNGIAGPQDKDVARPRITKPFPAKITQQAIASSGKTHIGNYIVIVNVVVGTDGVPRDLCLQKSSGYGLDAAAAAAVPQYRFEPAKLHGKPVRMRVPVEVRFANPEIATGGNAGSGQPAE